MWTIENLDALMHQIAIQQPNQDLVLSGHFNRNPEGRDYFEQRVSQLRNQVQSSQRNGFDESVVAARHFWKSTNCKAPAFAFSVRGGSRMLFYHAPVSLAVTNRVSVSHSASLYLLCELRDNLNRFSLLHIRADEVHVAHFELGSRQFHLSFRAAFRSSSWNGALLESMRQFADHKANLPNSTWIMAAPEAILSECQGLLRRKVEMLDVDAGADFHSVQQSALHRFTVKEEQQSKRFAQSLLVRQKQGQPILLGPASVIAALETQAVRAVVLNARNPRDLAIRWARNDSDPFSFHDRVALLAKRHNTHVEIVNECEELLAAGGSACLLVK